MKVEMEHDEGFRILAEDVADYLATHNEDTLECIELRMVSHLIVGNCSVALLLWDYVNRHRDLFGMPEEAFSDRGS